MNDPRVVVALLLASVLTPQWLSAQGNAPAGMPPVADSSFKAFLVSFNAGANAMVNADPTPFMANASHADDVTLLTPFGENLRGWAAVGQRYEQAAKRFSPSGATMQLEYLAIEVQGDMAYTVVVQRGMYRPAGSDTTRASFTRATNVFRREDGKWKLVHRHMDHVQPDTAR